MVISNFQRSKGAAGEEEISPRTKRREALFKRESFGSVNSEKIQDRHEWALGEFLEKEKNLTREVLHSSVEPDEAGKVTGDFRKMASRLAKEDKTKRDSFRVHGLFAKIVDKSNTELPDDQDDSIIDSEEVIRPMRRRRKRIPWRIDPGRSSKVEVSTSSILQGRSISRLPISILPDEADEKRKHIVLEQFPYLLLRYSENYGDKFVFNSSVPC
ncbi:hypothetical protein GLOIN_2v1486106 [Rhizophagus irregularis DAOM 181602=DAOM 197198]|nr:hypothetical protein GLOIN_2v1486106 [Rhizophagus irregularis DAOM 181602=DAOM 197198]